jgi:hypothetical protein
MAKLGAVHKASWLKSQTSILPVVPYLDTHRWYSSSCTLGHRGHDLDRLRRLVPDVAVIGILLGWFVVRAWVRSALHYGAIAVAVVQFLLVRRPVSFISNSVDILAYSSYPLTIIV